MKDGHVRRYCSPSTTTRESADRAMCAALVRPALQQTALDISVFGNEPKRNHQWLPSAVLEPPVI